MTMYAKLNKELLKKYGSAFAYPEGARETLEMVRQLGVEPESESEINLERVRSAVTLRSLGDGVIATNSDCKVTLMNKVAEELTGWTEREAEGRHLTEVFNSRVRDMSLEDRESSALMAIESGLFIDPSEQRVLMSRNNQEHIIRENASPIRDRQNKIIGAVIVIRDITQKIRLGEERLRASKLDSIKVLAGGIAHDFNNILAGILGHLSLAKLSCGGRGDLFERMDQMEQAVQRAAELTKQLLSFSKDQVPKREPIYLFEVIKEAVHFCMRGSHCKAEITLDPRLWPVDVDSGQINQVINNLIINAIQAMPSGGLIKVDAQNTVVGSDLPVTLKVGRYIRVTIEDQGKGISPDDMKRVFDPYFTTKPKGNGLGLASSYSIMKNHKGNMTISSELGKGTVVNLFLPATQKTVAHRAKHGHPAHKGYGKALVMDDESRVRDLLTEMLKTMNYEAHSVSDGEDMLAAYREEMAAGSPYRFVILDLTIPGGMGGRRAIDHLLEMDPNAQAIVTSGYHNDPAMTDFKNAGFVAALSKPFRMEDLEDALDSVSQ